MHYKIMLIFMQIDIVNNVIISINQQLPKHLISVYRK